MEKNKKIPERPNYKIKVLIRDYSKPILVNQEGKHVTPARWEEVKEVNLGSFKCPNKDIFQIKLDPIRYEDEEFDGEDFRNMFGRWFK